ncbi:MAG TPA: hypothetical protein VGM49_07575 [Candidatus Limnocylindrales bacterium]|jgi:hypothetical protein
MTAQARLDLSVQRCIPTSTAKRASLIATIGWLAWLAVGTAGVSLANFTAQSAGQAVFGSKAVFPGERGAPAFHVGDASSGSEIDGSNPFAFSADGMTVTTGFWSGSYAADRYLEFDLNSSLASGIAVSSALFAFSFASSSAGQACYYFEVRRISTGTVVATYGDAANSVGCVTGSTQTAFATSISVATTSIANDLRIRVFGRESDAAAMVIDDAMVSGSTAYQAFSLYPVIFRDAADTTLETTPWGLDAP